MTSRVHGGQVTPDEVRRLIREMLDELVELGELRVVGTDERGDPVYQMTDLGRVCLKLKENRLH